MRLQQVRAGREMSLVEVIVAVGFLTTVILGVMSLVPTSAAVQRTSRERAEAVALTNAQIDDLRATLRAGAMGTDSEREAQFTALLTAVGTETSAGIWENNGGSGTAITLNDGKVNATLFITAYTREDTAQTELNVTNLDLNADGTTGSSTDHPNSDLFVMPVRVRITWTTALNDSRTVQASALLY